ncbi:MAG: hypothetical protein KatS3mg050_4633 [Litorilinea sp.]|nr:MAG: hypothetical protein KatS3mg050_4633 [Litorilinea sp.]
MGGGAFFGNRIPYSVVVWGVLAWGYASLTWEKG